MSVPTLSPGALSCTLTAWLALAAVVFVVLLFVAAPYGRHRRPGWGPTLHAGFGWFLMEAPAVVCVALVFVTSERTGQPVAIVFLALWQLHYLYRAVIAPLGMRPTAAPIPVVVVGMGLLFNVVNGVLQGQWLFVLGPERPLAWLWHPAFLVGAGLYLAGVLVNRRADATLRALRAPGESGYRVPRGGLFDYVSCPNYLGEIIQWIGWAVATWSFAGLAFALWTTANLLPRALAHHRWYRSHFPDYPQQRRALLPFVL